MREVTTPSSPLSGVTYAAKGYFDALVKMGELASESQGSKELGKTLNRGRDPRGPEVGCPQADRGPCLVPSPSFIWDHVFPVQ